MAGRLRGVRRNGAIVGLLGLTGNNDTVYVLEVSEDEEFVWVVAVDSKIRISR